MCKRVYAVADIAQAFQVSRVTRAGTGNARHAHCDRGENGGHFPGGVLARSALLQPPL